MTPREHIEKRNLTVKDYQNAQEVLSTRMFDLFDTTGQEYNNNKGSSLMWNLSFTAPLVADSAMIFYDKGETLPNAIARALMENSPENSDLSHLLLY